jgi:hypothetical protein
MGKYVALFKKVNYRNTALSFSQHLLWRKTFKQFGIINFRFISNAEKMER